MTFYDPSIRSTLRSWWLAFRPKTLTIGLIPVLAGSFSTGLALKEIDWLIVFSASIFAVLMTVAVNLINDALDYKRGMDTEERIGPMRVTQSGLLSANQVLTAGVGVLVMAFMVALPLFLKGGLPVLLVILAAISCCYLYTGGPYPLSQHGFGEAFVLLFYGIAAVLIPYYLQLGYVSWDAFVVALQMGSFASVIIAINNLRDIEEDSKTGKKTLAVRWGAIFGKWEITALISLPFLLNAYWYARDHFLAFFLPSTSLLIAINLIRGIWKHEPSRLYNRYFGEAALLLTLFGLLLVLGLHASH